MELGNELFLLASLKMQKVIFGTDLSGMKKEKMDQAMNFLTQLKAQLPKLPNILKVGAAKEILIIVKRY